MRLSEYLMKELDQPPRRKHRGRPEAKIQKQIAAYLIGKGVVLAITDAGVLARMGAGMNCGIPAGWPDITGCMPGGRFIGVECKAATGKQDRLQVLAQMKIEGNGGLYILAHSLEELVEELAKENVLNPLEFPLDE
jgi:hypothetical protein